MESLKKTIVHRSSDDDSIITALLKLCGATLSEAELRRNARAGAILG
jgi:hypothetical protein